VKKTDSFLVTYAALSLSSVVVLSLIDVEAIDVYVALFAIEFFVASELSSGLSPTVMRRKAIIEIALLAVFAVIVLERVVEILR
jgi:hypothetical protein